MKKIFFFVLILFSACAKDKQGSVSLIAPETFLNYIQSKIPQQPDAIISVFCDPVLKEFPKPKILVSAFLSSDLDNGDAIQEVSFANLKLSKVLDKPNNKVSFSTYTDVINPFNQKVAVNFKTTFFDFKGDFHLPELVKLDVGSKKFSKSKGYTINWNRGEDNDLPVQISFMYDEVATAFLNPKASLAKEDLQITKFVKDDGNFTLTSTDLAPFPLGSIVKVSIKRGSFSYQKSNDKNILIYSITTDTYPVLVVED